MYSTVYEYKGYPCVQQIGMYLKYLYPVGWSDFFFIGQKLALNQRSGMILEVQIQIFESTSKFSLSQNTRGLKINICL